MSNELVVIEESTALEVFTTNGGLDPIIQQAKNAVAEFSHDMSTKASRGRTASLARKVASLKTKLDSIGKESTADLKAKAKLVDESRKAMRDELDALKIIARKPLTEWEEEQARIEAEKAAAEEAARIKAEIETAHELAVLMNTEFDRQLAERLAEEARLEKERQAQLEKERLEREARIAREAKEKARQEEIARQKAEEQRKREERERLEANKQHCGKIHRQAVADIVNACGLTESQAKAVVTAIAKRQISNVEIGY